MTVGVYRADRQVARWLQPKSAKRCYKKLLDSTHSLVTNFQLKSAKSNEILLKLCCIKMLKRYLQSYAVY